jgi:alanine racemase
VEIDLDAIAGNVAAVRRLLAPEVRLLAVVKADGYGHGLVPAARVAVARGAAMLGVTHPGDGAVLRKAGITAPILVFRPLLPGEEEDAVRHRLTTSIGSLDQARRMAAAAAGSGRLVAAHLKIETGMGRTGFTPSSLREALDELLSIREVKWEGIYTHFAAAADASFTRRQYRIFESLVDELSQHGLHVPLRHVCNSAATLLYPELHLDMVRVGTLLYGQLPAGIGQKALPEWLKLRDPWSFWTRVVHIQPVRRGDTVGYGRTHRVRRDTVLAVLPVGYSDGFGLDVIPRPAGLFDLLKLLAKTAGAWFGMQLGAGFVNIGGRPAPVLGRVGMELSCVDVGKLMEKWEGVPVAVGTPVRLSGRRTAIRASVPRVYITGGAVEDGVEDGAMLRHLEGDGAGLDDAAARPEAGDAAGLDDAAARHVAGDEGDSSPTLEE